VDAGSVQMLMDMGFAREAATAALVANHGKLSPHQVLKLLCL
jgi:hypothetical protein